VLQAFVLPNDDEEKPFCIEFLYRDTPTRREPDPVRSIERAKEDITALIRNRYKFPPSVEIDWTENPSPSSSITPEI
jgi:hypothetical protein